MRRILATVLSLAVVTAGLGLARSSHSAEPKQKDLVDVAVEAGSFKTLVKAVQAAGLVGTLKGNGPFTVFAPTDEAFAKLPEGTLEALLKDKAKLTAVLTYHVVAGEYPAAKVVEKKSLDSLQGSPIKVHVTNAGVKVNQANVVKTDVRASNGIIHVIDAVILPPEKPKASAATCPLAK